MIHGRLGSIAVCIAHFSLLSAMDIDRNHRAAYPNCGMADSRVHAIINGKEAEKPIPWAVYIETHPLPSRGEHHGGGLCGGSLITRHHVVSAAHCFCEYFPPNMCGLLVKGSSKFQKLRGAARIIMRIGSVDRNEGDEFEAKAVEVHKDYVMSNPPVNPEMFDISLITLSTPVELSPTKQVICLPKDDWSPEELVKPIPLTVAGWGLARAENTYQGSHSCLTTRPSPTRYMECQSDCERREPYPTYEWCTETYQKLKPDGRAEAFRLKLQDRRSVFCPRPSYGPAGQFGWCFTAKGKSMQPHKDWGFCSRSCSFQAFQSPDKLQYVQLFKLVNCSRYIKEGYMDDASEFCLSGIMYNPMVAIYRVLSTGVDGWTTQLRRIKKATFNDIGFLDSCNGDSGGPNWQIVKDREMVDRAVLVGLVSRGALSCGNMHSRETGDTHVGVSTTVAKYKDWLMQRISGDVNAEADKNKKK